MEGEGNAPASSGALVQGFDVAVDQLPGAGVLPCYFCISIYTHTHT